MNDNKIDPDMLRRKYLDEGFSDRQIAETPGVPEQRVCQTLCKICNSRKKDR